MNVQNFTIKQISICLEDVEARKDIKGDGTTKILFDLLIRWYPQFMEKIDTYSYPLEWKKYHKFSKRAFICAKLVQDDSELTEKEKRKKLKHYLHYEHNPPVEVLSQKILALPDDSDYINEITNIIKEANYSVVIITKDERRWLDGNIKKDYSVHGESEKGLGLSKSGSFEEREKAISTVFKSWEDWINSK